MKIAACGNVCMDITPSFPEGKTGNVFTPGAMVTVGAADMHTGGSVANTGLALKIFGADVTLIAKVGKDDFGSAIKNIFNEYGCGDGIITDKSLSTSYSVIMAPPGIDRIIFHNTGANDSFYCDDIPDSALDGVGLFHFGYPPLMKSMFENGASELIKLFTRIKNMGIETSLDMAFFDENAPAAKEDWVEILKKVLPLTDIFLPSAEEILRMADKENFERIRSKAGSGDLIDSIDIEKDIKPLANKLIIWGTKNVVIKCGHKGMVYANKDKCIFTTCYKPEKIYSATGAGDVSIAGFLMAYSKGYEPEKCLECASAAGALSLGAYNALGALTSFDELLLKMENWEKAQ